MGVLEIETHVKELITPFGCCTFEPFLRVLAVGYGAYDEVIHVVNKSQGSKRRVQRDCRYRLVSICKQYVQDCSPVLLKRQQPKRLQPQ